MRTRNKDTLPTKTHTTFLKEKRRHVKTSFMPPLFILFCKYRKYSAMTPNDSERQKGQYVDNEATSKWQPHTTYKDRVKKLNNENFHRESATIMAAGLVIMQNKD